MTNISLSNLRFPLLIDGGLSNVLEEQGCDLNHDLWSAHILESNPEEIIKAHLTYLESGAQCITTSSYQASIPGFMKLGYSRSKAESLILKSVELAEIAVHRFMASNNDKLNPLIAASIGPYGAYLADGSEYTGNYGVSDEVLYEFHYDRIKLLDQSSSDIFAIETIPGYKEAKVLSDILKQSKKFAWISFSCKDEQNINDGTLIVKAVALFKNHPNVFAIGVNCTNPRYISAIIQTLRSAIGDKRIIVYPNSGESYNAKSKTWMGISDPNLFSEMTKEWIDLGADIIGGCCRIGPQHICSLSKILNN